MSASSDSGGSKVVDQGAPIKKLPKGGFFIGALGRTRKKQATVLSVLALKTDWRTGCLTKRVSRLRERSGRSPIARGSSPSERARFL